MLTSLIPLFVGPAVLLPIAAYAVLHRRVRSAGWYALLLVAIAHWSIAYAWELTAGEIEFKVLVLEIKTSASAPSPRSGSGSCSISSAPIRPASAAPSVPSARSRPALLILAWTDGWHHAFWGPITVDTAGAFDLLIGRGPGFYVNIIFTYAALWAGIGILATRAFQSPYLYARRCGILIAATLLPWLGNLIFLMEADSVANIDPTPFLFACTGVGAVVAVFHYRMLDPIPALSDARVENLGDGVLVVDPQGRLADLNGAAQAILGRRASEMAGTPLDHALPGWTCRGSPRRRGPDADHRRRRRAHLRDTGRRHPGRLDGPAGYMVLLHDVTERRAAAATIRESEQRYRQLVENAHDLIFTRDLGGHLRSINRAGLAATASPARDRRPVDPRSRHRRDAAAFRGAAAGGRRRRCAGADRDRHHRQERTPRAARSGRLDPGRRGPEPHHPGDRARPDDARALRGSAAPVAEDGGGRQLAAGIAHDFNNLLTVILGFTDIAERTLPADSASRP